MRTNLFFALLLALLPMLSSAKPILTNSLEIGDGASSDKQLQFRKAASSNPTIKWNNSLSALQFANDGSTFKAFNDAAALTNTVPVANGGTGVTSVTTAPAATSFAGWDANKNLSANNLIESYSTTATAAGTTVLTVGSAYQQYFTGSTTQTVQLPVASTLVLGQQFYIQNGSTGVVTVVSSGNNTVLSMAANSQVYLTCILTSGTTAASWGYTYSTISSVIPVAFGGTGASTLTTNAILVGNGTSPISAAGSSLTVNAHSSNGEYDIGANTAIGVVNGGTYPTWGVSNGDLFHQAQATSGQNFGNSTNGLLGSMSGTGVWSFGASSGTTTAGTHTFYNNSTSARTLYVQNLSSSTSADGVANLILVKGSGTTTTAQVFEYFTINAGANGSGFITANGASSATFGTASDVRLKKKIEDLTPQLDNISRLRPVEFEYRKKAKRGAGRQVGFIAQEMQKVYPDAVGTMEDGYLEISGWDKTSARLVKALQELKAQNDALRADFEAYRAEHP